MKWLTLFNKIGKQPIKITKYNDVKLLCGNYEYDVELTYKDNKPYLKIKEEENEIKK